MAEDRDIRDLHDDAGVVVIFRSQLTREAGRDYEQMSDDMVTLASEMPGFVDYRSYVGQTGERMSANACSSIKPEQPFGVKRFFEQVFAPNAYS